MRTTVAPSKSFTGIFVWSGLSAWRNFITIDTRLPRLKHHLEDKHVPALRHRSHIDGIEDLVVGRALCAAHVSQLPLQVVLQVLHAVEGDLELEGAAEGGRVVQHHHVVDLHLRHGGREGLFIAPLESSSSEKGRISL